MADRPIIFSAQMVRAILDGRKTQTRRALNQQPPAGTQFVMFDRGRSMWMASDQFGHGFLLKVPYAAGDTLWVRETWVRAWEMDEDGKPATAEQTFYRADGEPFSHWDNGDGTTRDTVPWRPSIHMPRWASRIALRVADVRVQRLQDISEEDARAEGVSPHSDRRNSEPHVASYADLWNSLNSKRGLGWETNPWVAAISFERVNTDG